mgnify:FL=1
MYKVFTRTWWRKNSEWPNGKEPHAGKKTTIARNVATEQEALQICQRWNATHKPGDLSKKAEYEQQ